MNDGTFDAFAKASNEGLLHPDPVLLERSHEPLSVQHEDVVRLGVVEFGLPGALAGDEVVPRSPRRSRWPRVL
jgi:hypothetical protein